MAYFALLWKARTVEKYRLDYENEKINSIMLADVELPRKTLFQKWSRYRYAAQKRISKTFRQWYPEEPHTSNFFLLLKTDQTYPNFLLKSILGFLGGLILAYLCFLFFVFQLSISRLNATVMSSVIGVLLTLGLAFSYRMRCLVFLLIPQFFSRVGRYTLTCYALVLILTGPATNTLKNSEVLSESMACSQEQIKISVSQLNESMRKPYNSMKDSMKIMMDKMKQISTQLKEAVVKINRLVLGVVSAIKSTFLWLNSVANTCNRKLRTPYEHCVHALEEGVKDCKDIYGYNFFWLCDVAYVAKASCAAVKPYSVFCTVAEYANEAMLATIKKRLKNFSDRIRALLYVEVHIHHSYTFCSNTSCGVSQVAAGIVTEIRKRADPILTWLSWSSCITSLSLLLIIFRAKHYQHMYDIRSRFDNRYITKELRDLDLKRLREGRETILPLNRRERAKYITTTSFRLLVSEKVYLNRSAVFMIITTFKLLIHMVADYSLYWVLMSIRYHGRFQSPMQVEVSSKDVLITGSGFVARFLRSIIDTLDIPLFSPTLTSRSCLPNPYPPDFQRYTQIGVLIFLLWLFALFEPYGLRLRHVIMGHYRPERAKARAVWLYNHILRTRGSFMKFARRKLHKDYKYSSEAKLSFRRWLHAHIPCHCFRSLLGINSEERNCLLCGTDEFLSNIDTELIKCRSRECPGIYCSSCFSDIGQLCTICLSPTDYGDLSDVSLEGGSADENSQSENDSDEDPEHDDKPNIGNSPEFCEELESDEDDKYPRQRKNIQTWNLFTKKNTTRDNVPLLPYTTHKSYKNTKLTYDQKTGNNQFITSCENNNAIGKLIFANSPYFVQVNKLSERSLASENLNYSKFVNTDAKDHFNFKRAENINSLMYKYLICEEQRKIYDSLIKTIASTEYIINVILTSRNKTSKKHSLSSVYCFRVIYRRTYLSQTNFYEIKKVDKSLSIKKLHQQTELARTLRKTSKKIIRCRKKIRDKEKYYNNKNLKSSVASFTCSNDYARNFERTFSNRNKKLNGKVNKAPLDDKQIKNEKDKHKGNKIEKLKSIQNKNITSIHVNEADNISCDGYGKFHTIWSKYWNYIKFYPKPCTFNKDQRKLPSSEVWKNYKRRKKRRNPTDTNPKENTAKKDIEEARKFRISTYFSDQEWIKKKYDAKVCPNKQKTDIDHSFCESFLKSRKVKESASIFGMVKLNTRSLCLRWGVPQTDGNVFSQDNCRCIESGSISPVIRIKSKAKSKISKMSTLTEQDITITALERFRKKIGRKQSSPCASDVIERIVSAVEVAREKIMKKGSCNSKTSITRRINYYRSLGINEFDNIVNEDQGDPQNKLTYFKRTFQDSRYDDTSMSKFKKRNRSVISDDSVSSKFDKSYHKDKADDGESHKKWTHMKKLKNLLPTIKEFYSSHFRNSINDEKPSVKNKERKGKCNDTASKGVNVIPTMKSFCCQHVETKLLRDHTTQIGKYLIEAAQSNSEQYTREAGVDTTHHTCTCATQRTVTSRDVGTWLDHQHCHHRHHVYNELHSSSRQDEQKKSYVRSKSSDRMSSPKPNKMDYNEISKDDLNNKGKKYDISSTSVDSLSLTSLSSIKSDGTKTDTTICSLATVVYNEERKAKGRKLRVVTKANQSTLTDRTKFCDVSTLTNDWWSPIVERKNKEIALDKKQGGCAMQNEKTRKRLRNRGMTTNGKIVTFRSRAQIIPTGTADVMSPSRYLLESQKYYNELFSSKFYAPHVFPVTQIQKHQDYKKKRSPKSSRHHKRRGHKNKRLEECYSPRRQFSPRKRNNDSIKSETPRRRNHHSSYLSREHKFYKCTPKQLLKIQDVFGSTN